MTSSPSPRIPDDLSSLQIPGPTEAEIAEFAELDEAAEVLARIDAQRDWAEVAADDAATIVAAEAARAAGLDPLSVIWDD